MLLTISGHSYSIPAASILLRRFWSRFKIFSTNFLCSSKVLSWKIIVKKSKFLKEEYFSLISFYKHQNNSTMKKTSLIHCILPCFAAYVPLEPSRRACIEDWSLSIYILRGKVEAKSNHQPRQMATSSWIDISTKYNLQTDTMKQCMHWWPW